MGLHHVASCEKIALGMIELSGCAKSSRVIVAGRHSFEIYRTLVQRGFRHVVSATWRLAPGQHDMAFISGHRGAYELEHLLECTLVTLKARATVGLWLAEGERAQEQTLRSLLERSGFRIEAATVCENGFLVAARRHQSNAVAVAA